MARRPSARPTPASTAMARPRAARSRRAPARGPGPGAFSSHPPRTVEWYYQRHTREGAARTLDLGRPAALAAVPAGGFRALSPLALLLFAPALHAARPDQDAIVEHRVLELELVEQRQEAHTLRPDVCGKVADLRDA